MLFLAIFIWALWTSIFLALISTWIFGGLIFASITNFQSVYRFSQKSHFHRMILIACLSTLVFIVYFISIAYFKAFITDFSIWLNFNDPYDLVNGSDMMTLYENGQSQLYINELWLHYLISENLRHDNICFSQRAIVCSATIEAINNYDSIANHFNLLFLTLVPTIICTLRSVILTSNDKKTSN